MITKRTINTLESLKVKVAALPPQQPVLLSNAQMKAMKLVAETNRHKMTQAQYDKCVQMGLLK